MCIVLRAEMRFVLFLLVLLFGVLQYSSSQATIFRRAHVRTNLRSVRKMGDHIICI